MFPWLSTVQAHSLSKSTNLALVARIGIIQNETKRRRSIVNRLISPDFGLLNADGYANVRAQYQLNIS